MSMSFVTRGGVGHVGICASAQYALAAIARGARIRSFVSIAGWYHDAESVATFTAAWRAPGFGSAARRGARDVDEVRRRDHGARLPPQRPRGARSISTIRKRR